MIFYFVRQFSARARNPFGGMREQCETAVAEDINSITFRLPEPPSRVSPIFRGYSHITFLISHKLPAGTNVGN